MKTFIVLTTILFVSFTSLFAQDPDLVKGVWLSDKKDAKVEIYKTGGKYLGKITWIKEMYESDGKTPKKDSKNSDEKLRNRNLLNLVVLSGFTYNDGEWIGGELYNPKSGKTYKCKMKLNGSCLELRGYIGSPMFGKTTVLTRVS